MAILDRKFSLSSFALPRSRHSDTFANIDAKALDRARKDPVVRRFAAKADAHLQRLRAEGRIHL